MKKILLALSIAVMAFSTNAQQIKLGGNLGLAVPMGDFGDVAGTGFGFSATGKYMLNEQMAVGANLGYYGFGEKEYSVGYGTVKVGYSIIPVTGLFHYYFLTEGLKVYAGGDLGFYSCKATVTTPSYSAYGYTVAGGTASTSETKIGFAPTVGVEYPINDMLSFEGNLKYQYIATSGTAITAFGINVGILYNLK
jgi:hypothetical protein